MRNLKSGLSLFLGQHTILERLSRCALQLLAMALVLALPVSAISLIMCGVTKMLNVIRFAALSGPLLRC